VPDHHDLLGGLAERDGALAQRVLTLGRLGVLDHLMQRGLAHIQVRQTPHSYMT